MSNPQYPNTTEYTNTTGHTNTGIPSHSNTVPDTHPETTTTTTTGTVHPLGTNTAHNKTSAGLGHNVKSAAAGVHGIGEALRGGACAAVDRAVDDPEGMQKNEAIMKEGEQEIDTGDFSRLTKDKEGVQHNQKNRGL